MALDDACKDFLWKAVIATHEDLQFYELPEPRASLVLYNRFDFKDEETGICIEQV